MNPSQDNTLFVAGSAGFVGRNVARALADDRPLIGLSRDPGMPDKDQSFPGYTWRVGDLFSRRQTLLAMMGARMGLYLVHSQRKSARFTQGNPGDMELLCADNFARAAQFNDLERIVHVSPAASTCGNDVADALRAYGTPVTTLRVPMVLGPEAATTMALFRLVRRLPLMILPAWTKTPIAPVVVEDLVELIRYFLDLPTPCDDTFDVDGPLPLSYAELIQQAAALDSRRRTFFTSSIAAPTFSTRWISFFSRQPVEVIRPFVDTFFNETPPLRPLPDDAPRPHREPAEALEAALIERRQVPRAVRRENRELVPRIKHREVRSVQRLPLPEGHDATWVAEEYARWLPSSYRAFLNVTFTDDRDLKFFLRPLPWPLLRLGLDEDVSYRDRQLYWIDGGLLAGPQDGGRLEFRVILHGRHVIAAIHDFRPRLPWFLYRLTQAIIHGLVMSAFGRHLDRLTRLTHVDVGE